MTFWYKDIFHIKPSLMCPGPLFFWSFSLIPLSTFQQSSVLCFLTWTLIKTQPSRLLPAALKFSPPADGFAHSAGGYLETLMEHQPPPDFFGLNSSNGAAHLPPAPPRSKVLQTRACNLFNSSHLFPCNLRRQQQQQPACYCRRCCFITDGGGGGVATAARLPRRLVFVALCGMFVHYPLTE